MTPFGLTDDQILGLDDQRPRLEAEAQLAQARGGKLKLSPRGWHQLTLLATGDPDQAEDAHNAAVMRALKAGEQPGDVLE